MIICIDPVCRKCGLNDPEHHTVVDWPGVKILVQSAEVQNRISQWSCPHCGSEAAYWYFYRKLSKEYTDEEFGRLKDSDKETLELDSIRSCFHCSESGEIKKPSGFVDRIARHTATGWENL